MKPDPPGARISPIDSERFGLRIARAPWLSGDGIPEALAFCRENDVACLFASCDVNERASIVELCRAGFLLMETIVVYERSFERRPLGEIRPVEGVMVRSVRPEDADGVAELARKTFGRHVSHYHADERLDPERCAEVYPDWARRSCLDRSVADEVLVAEEEGQLTGFLTLRMNTPEEGEPPLSGVVPDVRGKGAYESLVHRGMEWAVSRGAKKFIGVMQIHNAAVLGAAIRAQHFPKSAFHIFHRWFD